MPDLTSTADMIRALSGVRGGDMPPDPMATMMGALFPPRTQPTVPPVPNDVRNQGLAMLAYRMGGGNPTTVSRPRDPFWSKNDMYANMGDAIGVSDMVPRGYAEGGRPPVGQPSIVGENGPEIFAPDQPGTVLPSTALEAAIQDYTNKQRGEHAQQGIQNFNQHVLQPALAEWAHTAPMALPAGAGPGGMPRIIGNAPAAASSVKEFFNANRSTPSIPMPEFLNANRTTPPQLPKALEFFNANRPQGPRPAWMEQFNANKPAPPPTPPDTSWVHGIMDEMAQKRMATEAAAQQQRELEQSIIAAHRAKQDAMAKQVLDMKRNATGPAGGNANLMNQVLDMEQAANSRSTPLRHDPRGYNIMRNPEPIAPAPWQKFFGRYALPPIIAGGAAPYMPTQDPNGR